MNNILNQIIISGVGDEYVCLRNTVGHVWWLPCNRMRRYMSLFQPSSLKGSIVSLLLPYFYRSERLLRFIHAERVRQSFQPDFISGLSKCFGVDDITCAVFGGSPGYHQKPTLLVASQGKVIGYCKLSDSKNIINLFRRETETLRMLQKAGVEHLPRACYCGPISKESNIWAFCQTTERNCHERIARIESPEVLTFVLQMQKRTHCEMPLEQSDFGQTLNRLETLAPQLDDESMTSTVLEHIADIRQKLTGKACSFSAFHGDLTPWNSFIVDGHLFAFDLEYAKMSYPLYADLFHLFTQSCLVDYNNTADEIYSKYQHLKTTVFKDICSCDFLYRCYLLHIICFFLDRDNGIKDNHMRKSFVIWVELLKYINNRKRSTKLYLGLKENVLNWMRGLR